MTRGAKRSLAAFVALIALFVTGCGGGGGADESTGGTSAGGNGAAKNIEEFGSKANGSAAKQLEVALHRYLDARSAGEWQRACSYLETPSRRLVARFAEKSKQVDARGCNAGIAIGTKQLSPAERAGLARIDIESVRIEGKRAFVLYRDAEGDRYAMTASREGARWGFSLSPLPL